MALGCLGLLFFILVAVPACLGQGVPAKCSACRAAASELADRLDKEKPRNHLDMRHRLDKHGNRYGKVIDYKMSELRVIELLEDLCSSMSGYELVPEDKNASMPARWAKSSELGVNRNFERAKMRDHQKLLENYCAGLIEQHEDEVAHAIRMAEVDADGISDYLCYELSKHCTTRQQQQVEPSSAEDTAAEEVSAAATNEEL